MTTDPGALIFGLHIFSCLFMTGLIWFVQVVHYPLFRLTGSDAFAAFVRAHQARTGWVVAPVMIFELLTALWIAYAASPWLDAPVRVFGLVLLVIIWGSTFAVQVPLHRRLTRGLDRDAVERLVRSNWIRTALWTTRSVLLLTGLSRSGTI